MTFEPKDVFKKPQLIFEQFAYKGAADAPDKSNVFSAIQATNRDRYARYHAKVCEAKKAKKRAQRHRPSNKYRAYQYNAQRRGLAFTLSYADCYHMFTSPCHYCHVALVAPLTHGIDRVNNALSYTPENTVPCCAMCNYMKHKYDYEAFLTQCEMIAKASKTAH